MKKYILSLILILTLVLNTISVFAYDNLPSEVKIGLYYGSSALSEPEISCDGYVTVKNGDEEVAAGQKLVIRTEEGFTNIYDGEELVYTNETLNDLTYHATEKGYIRINGKEYRGFLITKLLPSGLYTIINQVNLEEYLYGVVPKELSTSFPMEALKAQAVCARTYATRNIGTYSSYGFDMTNGQSSQVYGGVSVEAADCTQAVDETKGQVVMYNGKPAETFYFSTSSGVTLNSKDVWLADLPYLTSVEDPYQDLIKPDKMAWNLTVTAARLKEILANSGIDIGDITDLVAETNEQGAVVKLTFVGTDGTKSYTRESARNVLGLKSQVYTITANRPQTIENKSMFAISKNGTGSISGKISLIAKDGVMGKTSITVITSEGIKTIESEDVVSTTDTETELSFTLNGLGWGHGVGMSQNGAIGMAKSGFTYKEILTHYFKGTTVE